MKLPAPQMLGLVYGLSELGLYLFKRSKRGKVERSDSHSLGIIWVVVVISLVLAYSLTVSATRFAWPASTMRYTIGLAVFVVGLAWRWYSIYTLGRFFTVDVAIASDQTVIQHGPYRFLRHPSYLGALLGFAGLGICMANTLALVAILVPVLVVFMYRIQVEEAALLRGLGEPYAQYRQRTWRLIPFVF